MTTMHDKLARAIATGMGYDYDKAFLDKPDWVSRRGNNGSRFCDVNEPFQVDFDEAAYAVLDALMEPTREMWEAGGNGAVSSHGLHHDVVTGAVWANMIQAAKEGR